MSLHLTGEIFKLATGTNLVHIAYKGSAPALTDLIRSEIAKYAKVIKAAGIRAE